MAMGDDLIRPMVKELIKEHIKLMVIEMKALMMIDVWSNIDEHG